MDTSRVGAVVRALFPLVFLFAQFRWRSDPGCHGIALVYSHSVPREQSDARKGHRCGGEVGTAEPFGIVATPRGCGPSSTRSWTSRRAYPGRGCSQLKVEPEGKATVETRTTSDGSLAPHITVNLRKNQEAWAMSHGAVNPAVETGPKCTYSIAGNGDHTTDGAKDRMREPALHHRRPSCSRHPLLCPLVLERLRLQTLVGAGLAAFP